jgi:hypothetical protein
VVATFKLDLPITTDADDDASPVNRLVLVLVIMTALPGDDPAEDME